MRKPARSLHAPDGLVGMTGRYRRNDLRGPGVLWHLKNSDLSNASSQSPESERRFHKRKNNPRRQPAYYPRILLCRILELLHRAVGKTGNRRTVPEFGFAEFWSFVPLQRKTQCLRQNLVAKVLWHLKSHTLPKAPSQSPEFSGAEFGKKNAGFISGKTFQSENRQTIQKLGESRFFCFD